LDCAEFLQFHGVFEGLRDPARFAMVRVVPDWGTIAWQTVRSESLYRSRVHNRSVPHPLEPGAKPFGRTMSLA
jgi:hypothetical protein